MKKMLKFVTMFVFVAVFTMLVGCASVSFTPRNQGVVTGKLLYTTYVKVAETQDKEFKAKVEKLWTVINSIQSTDDLNKQYQQLQAQFNEILTSKGLSTTDAQLLTSIANDVLVRVKEVIDAKVTLDSDGVQFLLGVREGVNSMITFTASAKKK